MAIHNNVKLMLTPVPFYVLSILGWLLSKPSIWCYTQLSTSGISNRNPLTKMMNVEGKEALNKKNGEIQCKNLLL